MNLIKSPFFFIFTLFLIINTSAQAHECITLEKAKDILSVEIIGNPTITPERRTPIVQSLEPTFFIEFGYETSERFNVGQCDEDEICYSIYLVSCLGEVTIEQGEDIIPCGDQCGPNG